MYTIITKDEIKINNGNFFLNIYINLKDVDDIDYCRNMQLQSEKLINKTENNLAIVHKTVLGKLKSV